LQDSWQVANSLAIGPPEWTATNGPSPLQAAALIDAFWALSL
jgi:hypothetical protein